MSDLSGLNPENQLELFSYGLDSGLKISQEGSQVKYERTETLFIEGTSGKTLKYTILAEPNDEVSKIKALFQQAQSVLRPQIDQQIQERRETVSEQGLFLGGERVYVVLTDEQAITTVDDIRKISSQLEVAPPAKQTPAEEKVVTIDEKTERNFLELCDDVGMDGDKQLKHLEAAYKEAHDLSLLKGEVKYIKAGDLQFLAKVNKQGQVVLHYIAKHLGTGGYGSVFETVNLMKGTHKALKIGSSADYDIMTLNEYQMGRHLKAMNGGEQPAGIQIGAKKVVRIPDTQEGVVALWMKEYDGTLERLTSKMGESEKTVQERYESFRPLLHQLLKGGAFLAQNRILHGDIQPGNILVDEKEGLAHIADLGGARDMNLLLDKLHKGEEIPIEGLFTIGPACVELFARGADVDKAKSLALRANQLIAKYNEEIRKPENKDTIDELKNAIYKLAEEFIISETKRDTFAMGTVLYSALFGEAPFKEYSSKGFPVGTLAPTEKHELIPKPLMQLLERMLSPDASERPTPQEALREFEAMAL